MHRGISADDLIKMARAKSEKSNDTDVQMNNKISNLSQSEALFFLQMVNLFTAYRTREITADEAKAMKNKFIKDLEKYQMLERIFREDCEIRNKQSHWLIKAEKQGCEICKKLVRIFDGREQE